MNNDKKKIILFDDDKDILAICKFFLLSQGWEVHVFKDCNDIEQKVSAIMPDIILMDNSIPDAGGVISTRILKNNDQLSHIRVIFFSANSAVEQLAKKAGAGDYLAKPFDLAGLEKVINPPIK